MKDRLKNKKRIIPVLLIVSMLVMLYPLGALADTQDDLDDVKEQADEVRYEKTQMEGVVEQKQAELDAINGEINTLQGTIDAKQLEIEEMTAKVEEMQKNVDEQKGGLGNRLRNMYKSGSTGMFDILLNSDGFSDFLSSLSLVQRIYDADQKTLDELEEKHRALQEALGELEAAKAELDAAMSEMQDKKAQAEAIKAEYDNALAALKQELAELEAEAARLQKVIEEEQAALRRQMEEAARAAAAAQASSAASTEVYNNFTAASGEGFAWPAAGSLTGYFGYRPPSATNGIGSTNHQGIDIACPMYSVVRASKSGYVSGATGWFGGLGNAVFINHGDGFTTTYGHNAQILVSPGQYVTQGQAIAYAGSTGNSTGPHVHFEIRINGVAVDPLGYL